MSYDTFKRVFDLFICLVITTPVLIASLFIILISLVTSGFPILFWSDRVGKNNKIFKMAKFRTMKLDTPDVATHLLADPERYLTPVGKFLRKSSLDELPQFLNILKGEMSFVGPRPALYNQEDLIKKRTASQIDKLKPGLTGWAQINGRDELSIDEKVIFDREYFERKNLIFDLKILFLTVLSVVKVKGIKH